MLPVTQITFKPFKYISSNPISRQFFNDLQCQAPSSGPDRHLSLYFLYIELHLFFSTSEMIA